MKSKNTSQKFYHLYDASEIAFGRMATQIAFKLEGKHRPDFAPNQPGKDHIVVINADNLKFSGKKDQSKLYHSFSGYPGGISTRKLADLLKENPEKVIHDAVYNMLPKNKLRDQRMKRLRIFRGADHDLSVNFEKKS